MNIALRRTRKYTLKKQKQDKIRLRELRSQVANQEGFHAHHGRLLSILKIDVENGSLETLVQFYDLVYHFFTFLDYQLVPTLEEYSNIVGLPILDEVAFSGIEPVPQFPAIARALHLGASVVKAHLTYKGGLQGLPTKFLYQQASTLAEMASNDAFYFVLAQLIYGLTLFPNVDDFVDINAIQIFLTKNVTPRSQKYVI